MKEKEKGNGEENEERDGTYDNLVGELVWELHIGTRLCRRVVQPSEERTHARPDRKRAHRASALSRFVTSPSFLRVFPCSRDVSTSPLRRGGTYVPLHEARVLRGSGGGGRGVNAVCESLRGGAGE